MGKRHLDWIKALRIWSELGIIPQLLYKGGIE
jgi:hypothetical protein